MKKIFLTLALCLACAIGFFIPAQTHKASAAALTEPNGEVDSLFIDAGAELYTLNADYNFEPGAKSEYLAEFDENGHCTKAGFKMVEVGDNLAGKVLYIYHKGFPLSIYTDKYFLNEREIRSTTDANDITAYISIGTSLSKFHFIHEEMTEENSIVNTATFCASYAGADVYAYVCLYYDVDEVEDNVEDKGESKEEESDSADSSEDTFFDKANKWTNDTFGLTLSASAFGSIVLIVGLILLFRRK